MMNAMQNTGVMEVRARRAGGFSLIELLIALGILGIALPMIGTAFLAGAVENKESIDTTMCVMVAENALAVVRSRVTHAGLCSGSSDRMNSFKRIKSSDGVNLEDLAWKPLKRQDDLPDGEDEQEDEWFFSCVVVYRRLADNANDYLLVAVPFKKFTESDTISSVEVAANSDGQITKCEVKLSSAEDGESAALGFLATRTALRP